MHFPGSKKHGYLSIRSCIVIQSRLNSLLYWYARAFILGSSVSSNSNLFQKAGRSASPTTSKYGCQNDFFPIYILVYILPLIFSYSKNSMSERYSPSGSSSKTSLFSS